MYAMEIERVIFIMLIAVILWCILNIALHDKKQWTAINFILLILSLCIILRYSVLGRTGTDIHRFTFAASYSNEFWREMLMNIFLYFPMGIALPNVLKKYGLSVLAAFIMSLAIETWQYFAGTGLAQGTDIICNTLGAVIGGLNFAVVRIN